MASIAFGVAIIVVAQYLAAWILNLNAHRAIAEAMVASMAANDAALHSGRERRARIDPLNPATWSLQAPAADEVPEADRRRTMEAMRQIALVDIGTTKVWRPSAFAIGGIIAACGLLALAFAGRRTGLFIAIAALGLLVTVLTEIGLRVMIVYGRYQPRPVRDYVLIAAAGGAYPLLLIMLVTFRCRRSRMSPVSPTQVSLPDAQPGPGDGQP